MKQNDKNMSKEIDCNCNDCKFLVRSFAPRQKHEDLHYLSQKESFDTMRLKFLKKVDKHLMKIERGLISEEEGRAKVKAIMKQVKKLDFQFSRATLSLSYGRCVVNGNNDSDIKEVSFVPNTCQLHTHECFELR